MEIVEELDDALGYLETPRLSQNKSIQVAEEYPDVSWLLLGNESMMKKGIYEYTFKHTSKLSMYSPELEIRRRLTTLELEIIEDLIEEGKL
jgi:hypothetical protein